MPATRPDSSFLDDRTWRRPHAPASTLVVSPDVAPADWDRFVLAHPRATIDHLWSWREIFDGVFGHRSVYLAARRGDAVVGILPLVLIRSRLFGRFAVSVPFLNYGGVLSLDTTAARALIDAAGRIAEEFRATHLELRHRDRIAPDLACREHKVALCRPLDGDAGRLWLEIDRKVRNQIRKARKEGLTAVWGGAELLDDFYAVFAENMRDLGTPVYSRGLFVETLRVFADRARVFLVRLDDQPLAGAITLSMNGTVIVPWASSLQAARHLCPNMLLYWTMLERAASLGARWFDFGRSSRGTGAHAFKLQWGAVESPLFWEYVLLDRATPPDQGPTNPRFQTAIRVWQRLPIWLANGLGPRIVRSIP